MYIHMSRVRGQTICPSLHCSAAGHQHSKGANDSRYQSIYEPTEPSQAMMTVDESDRRWTTAPETTSPTLFE